MRALVVGSGAIEPGRAALLAERGHSSSIWQPLRPMTAPLMLNSRGSVVGGLLASYTVVNNSGVVSLMAKAGGGASVLSNVQSIQFSDQTIVACFMAGTRILTEHGEVAVEALEAGGKVLTRSGALQPLCWIGHRIMDRTRYADLAVTPVRIRQGAFGGRLPRRDRLFSSYHSVLVDGMLIPTRHIVNKTSILSGDIEEIAYWHILLGRHDVIVAEGLPAETYLDGEDRPRFDDEETAPMGIAMWEPCAPILTQGVLLQAARGELAERALAGMKGASRW